MIGVNNSVSCDSLQIRTSKLIKLVFEFTGILAVGFEKYGSEEKLKEDAITHLYEVYVKINADGETDESIHERAREFFVKMEAGTFNAPLFGIPSLAMVLITPSSVIVKATNKQLDYGKSSEISLLSNTKKPTPASTFTSTSIPVNPKSRNRLKLPHSTRFKLVVSSRKVKEP